MNEMVGRKITVYSVGATNDPSDVGTLEKVEGNWLWLRKSEREVLLFNIERIRAIKPFDPL